VRVRDDWDDWDVRARWLRQAVADVQSLREAAAAADKRAAEAAAAADQRVAVAEAALREARHETRHQKEWIASCDRSAEIFKDLIVLHADELRDTPTEAWPEILAGLETVAIDAADGNTTDALDTLRAFHETEGDGGDAA
jgi:hypothetical protein